MQEQFPELRGAIYARYRTQKEFAAALGWSPQKLYNVLNGRIDLKRRNILQIKQLLLIPDDRMTGIFLLNG